MRQVNRKKTFTGFLSGLIVALASTGCQQPTGPGSPQPLLPPNPMTGPTRIPPPPTGSIGGANTYVQPAPNAGQVSVGLPANDLVAAAQPPQTTIASPPTVVGSAVTASPVQPAGYQSSNTQAVASANATVAPVSSLGSGLAPAIPPAAMTASSYVDSSVPLRPQLRGMQPIDLTPTAQPQLQPVEAGNWSVAEQNQAGSGASFPSTQPTARAASTHTASRSTETPTSDAANRSEEDGTTASLPWRRPQVAR